MAFLFIWLLICKFSPFIAVYRFISICITLHIYIYIVYSFGVCVSPKLKLQFVPGYAEHHTPSKTPPDGGAHTIIHTNAQISLLLFIHEGCVECICSQIKCLGIILASLHVLPRWECLYSNSKLCQPLSVVMGSERWLKLVEGWD